MSEPSASADEVEHVAEAAGGYVESRSDGDRRSMLTIRVPSPELDATLDRVADLGDEQSRSVSAEDVTEQLADTEAALENARALRDRLRSLLDRATKVEEILKVETELRRIQTEIDQTEGSLKRLRSQVALSQIAVTLDRQQVLGPVSYVAKGVYWLVRKLFVLSE